jgi:autotransporter-associated beta strand protein
MKHYPTDYRAGVRRALVKRSLLLGFSSLTALVFMTMPAAGIERNWTGALSANWSDPGNWNPAGTPQITDQLNFGWGPDSHRSMVNDIAGLRVAYLDFRNNDYQLDGNSLIVDQISNEDIDSNTSHTTTINCPLAFQHDDYTQIIATGGQVGQVTETTVDLYLNGPISVSDTTVYFDADSRSDLGGGNGHLYVSGVVSGSGDIIAFANEDGGHVSSVEFNGTPGNTLSGTVYLWTEGNTQIKFNKSSGFVATNHVAVIQGHAANLNLAGPNQIGNHATIEIDAGSRLNLSGNSVTVGSLVLTNYSADALASTLDTGSTTVGLNDGITTWTANDTVHPTIKGHLNLNGYLPFNVSDASGGPGPGFEIQATIGGNGFNKTGNGTLLLSGTNTFFGDVAATAGMIEAATATAFGQAGPTFGVHIAGGNVRLDNVAIGAEPLFVDAPSIIGLLTIGNCSWAGPVTLNTGLLVSAETNMDFSGAISGTGGIDCQCGNRAARRHDGQHFYGTTQCACRPVKIGEAFRHERIRRPAGGRRLPLFLRF